MPSNSSAASSSVPLGALASSEDSWLRSTFGLGGSGPVDPSAFYETAKTQQRLGRHHLAVRCLEIYIARLATPGATQPPPPPATVMTTARGGGGARDRDRDRAAAASGAGASASGAAVSLPVGPLHLLAFAHYGCGALARARECFHACVRLGYEADWQMIVQVELELAAANEADRRAPTIDQATEGRQALDTLRKHLAKQSTWMKTEDEEETQPDIPPASAQQSDLLSKQPSPELPFSEAPTRQHNLRASSDDSLASERSDLGEPSSPQEELVSGLYLFEAVPAVTPSTPSPSTANISSNEAHFTAMVTPSSGGSLSALEER